MVRLLSKQVGNSLLPKNPSVYSDVNGVLFENDILQQYGFEFTFNFKLLLVIISDFKGKTVRVWATHIQEREGCHWQVVMCDRNSCLVSFFLNSKIPSNICICCYP